VIFIFLPYLNLCFFLLLWLLYPSYLVLFNLFGGILFFIVILSLVSIPVLIISWYSNCKYSLIGGLRGVSQIVSYDCVIGFIFIRFIFLINNLDLEFYSDINNRFSFFVFFPVLLIWIICILAESNRSPFDFSEGESELVSGFNTEYSGFSFSGCFIGEYVSILFISLFSGFIFFCHISLFIGLSCLLFCFYYVWVRVFLPRYRYDKLIIASWKFLLPLGIIFYCFFSFFS